MTADQNSAEELAARLADWPMPIYATLDGAKYPDLPALLTQINIVPRSLFLDRRDSAIVQAGPFLVTLDTQRLTDLLTIADIEAAAVFWSAAVEEPVLYRHLRALNLADIPPEGGRSPGPVLFRHWDPGVLALTLPALEPGQLARLFGPANFLAFAAPEGVLTVARRSDWPGATRGRLRFSAQQMAMITDRMTARSRRAIAAYLRETAESLVRNMDDEALLAFVASSGSVAHAWGIATEAGIGRFAWLMLATGGQLEGMDSVRDWLNLGDIEPDKKLRTLMNATALRLCAQDPT